MTCPPPHPRPSLPVLSRAAWSGPAQWGSWVAFHQLDDCTLRNPLAGRSLWLVSRLLLSSLGDWGQPPVCSGACWGDVKDLMQAGEGPSWSVLLQASCLEWEVPGPGRYLGQRWPMADTGGSLFSLFR